MTPSTTPTATDRTGLQLQSLLQPNGELRLALARVPIPLPKPHEVVVRVEAAPINPSDLGLLLAGADPSTATASGSPELPILTARVPEGVLRSMTARFGVPMPVGNEGAG